MSEVETEILKLTKLKRKKNEPEQKFLNRVVAKIADVDDDEWDQLSEEAQDWSNTASDIFNENKKKKKKKDLPSFPEDDEEEEDDDPEDEDEDEDESEDDDSEDEDESEDDDSEDDDSEDEDEPEDDEEEDKPKKSSRSSKKSTTKKPAAKKSTAKKTADKKPAAKKSTTKKTADKKASGSGNRPKGGTVVIKEIMVEDPDINNADLTEELHKRGFTLTDFTISTVRADTRQTFRVLKDCGVLTKEFVKRYESKD